MGGESENEEFDQNEETSDFDVGEEEYEDYEETDSEEQEEDLEEGSYLSM